jgi:hypothetical protein
MMATYYGPGTITINHPISGDMRQNTTNNTMEVYNGSSWMPIASGWVEQETLAESVEHAQDQIGLYIEEDYADNPTIQDAYQEWAEATERFRVIASMAAK